MNDFLRYLSFFAYAVPSNPDFAYTSCAEVVLREGAWMPGAKLPEDVSRGAMGECFKNAAELATGNSRYIYCEGWATCGSVPLEHAWCIDLETGLVVDPTWEDNEDGTYLGVSLSDQTLTTFLAEYGYWGVLCNDYLVGHPVLRGDVAFSDDIRYYGKPIGSTDELKTAREEMTAFSHLSRRRAELLN